MAIAFGCSPFPFPFPFSFAVAMCLTFAPRWVIAGKHLIQQTLPRTEGACWRRATKGTNGPWSIIPEETARLSSLAVPLRVQGTPPLAAWAALKCALHVNGMETDDATHLDNADGISRYPHHLGRL
jgi:hypothetical protein